MSKIRLGFVGVGGMGQSAHLQNYVTLDDCEVVAIAELREELGRTVGQRYGIPKMYRTADELLANEKVDGIVASQQFAKHGSIVPPLLKVGVPVLTEKPLASSSQEGKRILGAASAPGSGRLLIGYNKRSDPATMRAKKQIAEWQASGEVGKLKYVRISMPPGDWIANGFSHLLHSKDAYPSIADDPKPAGISDADYKHYIWFVNYYIHQVNLLRHLLGEDYRVTHVDPAGVLLIAQSESGITGVIEMGTHETSIDWQETAFVAFEHGWIKIELVAPLASNRAGRVTMFSDKGGGAEPVTVTPTLPWIHSMRSQAMNFVKEIRGEKTPLCEASEALKDLLVADDYVRMFLATKGDSNAR